MSAFKTYCDDLYKEFKKNSWVDEELTQEEGTEVVVWEGYMIDAFRAVDVPKAYQSKVSRQLKQLKCIEVLQSGARNTHSKLRLLQSPQSVDWQPPAPRRLTDRSEFAKLVADLKIVQRRLGGLDIAVALSEIDKRVLVLEAQLAQMEEKLSGSQTK